MFPLHKKLLAPIVLLLVVLLGAACERLPSTMQEAAKRSTRGTRSTSTTVAPTTSTTAAPTTTTAAPTTTTAAPTTTTAAPTTTTAPAGGFVHPGVLVDRAQLDLVKAKVAAGAEPWKSAYTKASKSGYASLTWTPRPVSVIYAGGSASATWAAEHPEYGLAPAGGTEHLDDARAAYTDALMWYYTGNQAYAAKAIQIMNAWSGTLTKIAFNEPKPDGSSGTLWDQGKLQAGWGGSLWARAAEIIRYSGAGWSGADIARFETMLDSVFKPLTITGWSTNANWLMTLSEATIAIGVFTNNKATFDAGVSYWRTKVPTTIYLTKDGSQPVAPTSYWSTADRIKQYWFNPTSFPNGLQGETLRDLSHMMMGMGAMANAAETARIQGVNLYGEQAERFVAGFEKSARYINEYLDQVQANGGAAPASSWRPAGWVGSSFSLGGTAYQRGTELVQAHFVNKLGMSMPETTRLTLRTRQYDTAALHMTWETLTHAR